MNAALASANLVYLHTYLAPLTTYLERPDVTDIFVNRPGELWIETLSGGIERHDAPDLDETGLWRLARQIAALTHQGVSREHPLLAATLPDGARIQIVAPPATRGPLALAIRKHVSADLALEDYAQGGAFASTSISSLIAGRGAVGDLDAAAEKGDVRRLLSAAVKARKNIIVSGGTSTGKTTFLNALLREIPAEERLILIEDTPELRLAHENAIGLLAVRSELGESRVTAQDLVQASLRMRPDRIILGELRGVEAFSFLRAVNTGHPGSMTTIHADTPHGAIEQLALMVIQSGSGLAREDIVQYVRNLTDVVVQLGRTGARRHVVEVAVRNSNMR